MKQRHLAFIIGMFVFMITTMLAIMIPIAVKHGMDLTGKCTFVCIIMLGYFTSGLLLFDISQVKRKP